jgi:hypothetical protein
MKTVLTKRFFISWIMAAIVMFSLSYIWHGVFLNDFSRLNYPKQIFFVIAIIVYLIISLGIAIVYSHHRLDAYKKQPLKKGLIVGVAFGFALYMITLVIGVSFTRTLSLGNIMFDCAWQMLEQGIGGIVVGFASVVVSSEHLFDEA